MNRRLAGHVFWPLTERLLGRDTMARVRQLQRTSHLGLERLQALQAAKLRDLLIHAQRHSPFYRQRFDDLGFDPRALSSVRDLEQLPTLSREEVRANRDAMLWSGCRGGPRKCATGGSSGQPLIFYTDLQRQAADWAARWRARSWWGVNPGDPEILLWGAPAELRANDRFRQWRDALLNQEILSAFEMTPAAMGRYIERIRAVRPVCFYGYASSLGLLARHALDTGAVSPAQNAAVQRPSQREAASGRPQREAASEGVAGTALRAVFVTGEVLQESDRRAIEAAFVAPAVIEYGARDAGLLAYGCPAGRLHVPMENVIVELLGDDGRPVAAGEVGEVVVTHLETRAMPLIRYRVGDLAIAAADPCPCGRASQCLLEVRGRVTDQIVCREGKSLRRMHALSLMYVLREAEGLRQFRIVQPSIERLDIDVVADAQFTLETEHSVLAGLAQRMGPGVDIRLRRCEHIPPSASGKHACIVSEVK